MVVTKRFPFPEEGEVVAIIPWNGSTEMTVEKGFLPEKSPFGGLAAKVQREVKRIRIENNVFYYSCHFPELTVIRLVKKGAKEPAGPPVVDRDVFPQNKFDYNAVGHTVREEGLKKYPIRTAAGHAAAYGPNASFSRIPATGQDGFRKFAPPEKESIVVTHRVNADVPGRFDSVYLSLGQAAENACRLSFRVFARVSGLKKNDHYPWTRIRFILDGKCFSAGIPVGRWQQVVVPLDGINPSWRYLRIPGPGRVTDGNLQSISYEINDISVWAP